jgi:hypothetical protein
MFATSKDLKNAPEQQELEHYWTILLLTPSAFFEAPLRGQIDLVWTEIGKHRSKRIAELTSIVHALRVVVKRWAELYQHIEGLLREDFMDPEAYVKLLFDNENFSQSELYFWVIGCLNEFDISIEDNIKQWTLFREARVTPFLEEGLRCTSQDEGSSSSTGQKKMEDPEAASHDEGSSSNTGEKKMDYQKLRDLAEEVDDLCEILKNQKSQFEHQKKTVVALRDGVSCILIASFLYSTCPSGGNIN